MNKILFSLIAVLLFSSAARAETDKHLLNEMLTTVHTQYLEPVSIEDFTANGLQALNRLDSDITLSKGSDKFYLYYKKQIKKVIPLPADRQDINAWAETIAKVIDSAAAFSEAVALKDFEVPDLMMKQSVSKLDSYSRYYSEYDYEDSERENSIYTLYSDRKIGDILYLRVRIFNKQTAKQIKSSIERNTSVNGIILDLRGNSGGILNEALKTADFFADNEIIAYTAGRDGANIHYYTSEEGELYKGALVILVDGETASAAEVLAGGLQEQSRAKLIGTRTFGKGTIQNITQMSNGGRLVLTTEQFFTPSGKPIHGSGIIPDVCLSKADDGSCNKQNRLREDSDIESAIKLLKNEI